MSAHLLVYLPQQAVRMVTLGDNFSIGRGRHNDLPLADEATSRNHAVIQRRSDRQYYLVDCGSANGTILNKRQVTAPVALKAGDEIRIGHVRLVYEGVETQVFGPSPTGLPSQASTGVKRIQQVITILVVDVRQYARLSEALPATELSQFMTAWFTEAQQLIERHDGQIGNVIGDAIMSYWIHPPELVTGDLPSVTAPVRAAQELVQLAQAHHAKLVAQHSDLGFAVGCGIHLGEAILGHAVGAKRREFTAVGDCVNVAFRLESLCKELGQPIVVSKEVRDAAARTFEFVDHGPRSLKGKTNAMAVFTLRPVN